MKRTNRPLSSCARLFLLAATAFVLAALPGVSHAQTVDTWDGGTGNWSNGALWSAGVPNSASASVFVDGGKAVNSTVTVDGSYTVGALNISAGDAVNVNNGQTFTITDSGGFAGAGTLTNNGAFTLGNSSGGSTMFFNGTTTLAGTGTFTLVNNDVVLSNGGNGTLTIGSGQTVQGATGTAGGVGFGSGQLGIVNQGTFNANVSGQTLLISPNSSGLTNNGTLQASGGGVLQLSGNIANNATIAALAGSSVQLNADTNLTGGTLSTTGSGTINNIGTDTLTNVTNAGTFIANNGVTTNLAGTITNNGTIALGTTGGTTTFLNGTTTLAGTGTVTLVNGDVVLSNGGTGTVTIGQNQTIQGATGTGGGVGFGSGQLGIVNQGTFNANVSGQTLLISPNSSGLTNNGTLQASGGGVLQLSGNIANNGAMVVAAGSTITVPAAALTNLSGTTLTGGSYQITAASASNPATLSFVGGSVVTNNANVYLDGPGAVFNAINALTNNASGGYISVNDGYTFTTAGALTNAGVLSIGGANGSKLTISGSFDNSGRAFLSLNTDAVQGNVTNSGWLNVSSSTLNVQGTLINSGLLNPNVAATGTNPPGIVAVTGALTQTGAGTLFGTGTVTAPTLSLAGSLRPGDAYAGPGQFSSAVGTLTLNGQVGLLSNTVLVFDLASTTASDEIKVGGALTLAGMLNVNALTGFGAGRYDLIDYSGVLTNNGLALGTLPSGYNYAIDTSMGGQVDLVVTNAVPEPSTWVGGALVGLGLLGAVHRRLRSASLV